MNETHTRLRGHINKYIENIEGLFHICTADGHETHKKNTVLNYTNRFWQASIEFDRELTEYESFVIRQPLQRIIKARKRFEEYKARDFAIRTYFQSNVCYFDFVKMWDITDKFDKTGILPKITKYKNDLENGINISKLHFAGELTSVRITPIVEQYQESISRMRETTAKLWVDAANVYRVNCACFIEAEDEPILRAVFVKLYGHYKVATASEKAAMREYFKFEDDKQTKSFRGKLVRGEMTGFVCITNVLPPWTGSEVIRCSTLYR